MDVSLWWVLCGLGALLIRLAYAMHVAGMARSKNSAGAVMRVVVDAGLATLAFWLIGGALLDSPDGAVNWRLIGSLRGQSAPGMLFFFLTAVLIATGAVVGVVGERSKFFPMCAAPLVLAGVVVPLAARWTLLDGWLARLGFVDFAGAGAIQLTAAVAGLVMAVMVGPRSGKYNRDGSSNAIPGHSVPLASMGILLLMIGWIGYLAGFARPAASAGTVAMNTMLAAAAGGTVSLIIGHLRYFKPDIHITYAGLVGALAAVSALAGTSSSWAAVLTGVLAGAAVPAVLLIMDLVWKVDDVTGGIGVHGAGALIGLLVAPFAASVSWAQTFKSLGVQLLGIVVIAALTAGIFIPLYYVLKQAFGLRSKEADEYDGLDLAEHDINAYPDFQQTMIKSYHLREA